MEPLLLVEQVRSWSMLCLSFEWQTELRCSALNHISIIITSTGKKGVSKTQPQTVRGEMRPAKAALLMT